MTALSLLFTSFAAPAFAAPSLMSSVPLSSATGVAADANIVLTFSGNLEFASGQAFALKDGSTSFETFTVSGVSNASGSSGGSATIGSGGNGTTSVITINPGSSLGSGVTYVLDVGPTALNAKNSPADRVSAFSLTFTTAVAAPTLSSSVPAASAIGVAVDADLVFTFNGNVHLVSSQTVLLKSGLVIVETFTFNSTTVGTGSLSGTVAVSGNTVTINPGISLDNGVTYVLEIGATDISVAGSPSVLFAGTNISFTAVLATRSVTYVLNGGTSALPVQSGVLQGSLFTLAGAASQAGYDFNGWSDGLVVLEAGDPYTARAENVTLTAQWTRLLAITFDANGGVGAIPTDSAYYANGAVIGLPGVGFLTKNGHSFSGWNTLSTGLGTSYSSSLTAGVGGTIVLYAEWNPISISGGNAVDTPVAPVETEPVAPQVPIKASKTVLVSSILFKGGSIKLSKASKAAVVATAQKLVGKKLLKVTVTGYAYGASTKKIRAFAIARAMATAQTLRAAGIRVPIYRLAITSFAKRSADIRADWLE